MSALRNTKDWSNFFLNGSYGPEADLVRKVRKFTFGADMRIPLANWAADPDALIVFLELKAVDNKFQLGHSTYLGVF